MFFGFGNSFVDANAFSVLSIKFIILETEQLLRCNYSPAHFEMLFFDHLLYKLVLVLDPRMYAQKLREEQALK